MSQKKPHIDSLLQQCLNQDATAQLKIYESYYRSMYNTALRIVKDSKEAEDVMQNSFLNAFTKLHTFKGEVPFGAWLKRIVINNSIQHYNTRKKKNTVSLNDHMYKAEDTDAIEGDSIETAAMAQKVVATMNTLNDNYRISLTLHFIEGYDYEEICGIMNISYANCRTMISRAKESLRKKLSYEHAK